MTRQELDKHRGEILELCSLIQTNKAAAYETDNDVLGNFKSIADLLQLQPSQVLTVYLMKHIIAIINAIVDDPAEPTDASEGMTGRIADAINYLVLLYGMIESEE